MPIAFGLVSAPAGLWLWNGLGPSFGLKDANGNVNRTAALGTLSLLAITLIAEVLIDSR
jgi:hypothetical protein